MSESPCPDEATLAAYVGRRLDDRDAEDVTRHLIDCDPCYRTVASAALYLGTGARPSDVAPRWALAPALITGLVMALVLTALLLKLGYGL